MKYLKIVILRNKTLKNEKMWHFLDVNHFHFLIVNYKVTKIRRNLKMIIFFYLVHNFLNLEEIKQNLFEINSKIKLLRFKIGSTIINNKKNIFFAVLDASKNKKYFAKDIFLPSWIKVVDLEEALFQKISSSIKIKFLIKVESKKGNYGNPLERVNFIIEKDEIFDFESNILFDLTTKRNVTPFKQFNSRIKTYQFKFFIIMFFNNTKIKIFFILFFNNSVIVLKYFFLFENLQVFDKGILILF
uniref:RNA polymerase alpha subunit n=1 Tax=Euglena hiemalis TaxID=392896 RepID=A0A345UC46_9EUGL|nr:RNA polymerase alpha subunit [Euglena hiemalis]AXI98032.1 RNA polymerase alpha subunit [Euglena hiemalis]